MPLLWLTSCYILKNQFEPFEVRVSAVLCVIVLKHRRRSKRKDWVPWSRITEQDAV